MSELLLNDENLTTADIAHPEKTTVAQRSAIDDCNPSARASGSCAPHSEGGHPVISRRRTA